MDPAGEHPIQTAVEIQGVMLGKHEEELSAARQAVETLAAQVTDLARQLHQCSLNPPALSGSVHSTEPRINNPPCYSGEPTQCRSFLIQCEVVFSLQPSTYSGDRARIAYVISLLSGRARQWGTAVWESRAVCVERFSLFKEEMIRVFDRSVYGEEASRLLSSLRQGKRSVTDFSIEFRTLATSCGWNEPALLARFLEGLHGGIRDEILSREVPTRLDALIDLALRIEKRFDQRRRARGLESALLAPPPADPLALPSSEPEAMQLGGIRISAAERERRVVNRLCMYCASPAHFVAVCPLKDRARQ